MNIVIAGGTGLIGKAIVQTFLESGHRIYILTRDVSRQENKIQYVNWSDIHDQLNEVDVLINLAGATINSRWTKDYKAKILQSRIVATQNCRSLLKKLTKKPSVFLNASAVGFYGTSTSKIFDETNTLAGNDFLATVVKEWEKEALLAEQLGVRTVLLRFGVVLSKDGGALKSMLLPYKLFAGGNIGKGTQWLSWIHINDVVNMVKFAIENSNISGPMNITTPNPVRMAHFGKALAEVIHRPHWLPTPSFALKILLGEMSLLVLEGQHVQPKVAMEHDFTHTYPELKAALNDLLM